MAEEEEGDVMSLCVFEFEKSLWINQAESWCQGASVLFSPVKTVALANRLKYLITFTPKPNCNLQNVLTKMCFLLEAHSACTFKN